MLKHAVAILIGLLLVIGIVEAKKIPKFNMITEEGYDFHRDDLKGKPSVLIFWGINCHSCRDELPQINKIFQKYKNNINFYAIAVDSSNITEIKKSRKKLKFDIPILLATKRIVYKFRVIGVPKILILDKNTKIYKIFYGVQDNKKIQKYLDELLKK